MTSIFLFEIIQLIGNPKVQNITIKTLAFDWKEYLKPSIDLIANSLVYKTNINTLNKGKYIPIVKDMPARPHPWAKCLNFKKDLFVNVNGLLTPCPWFNNGYHLNEFVNENYEKMSIKNRSFFDIVNDSDLWQQLVDKFNTDPLEICQLKCKNDE